MTGENKQKLQAIAQRFRKQLLFYPVQLSVSVQSLGGHVTQGALFRLLLPDLLQLDKVIYLDCDIVVNLDIAELWAVDLHDYPAAAALDPGMSAFPAVVRQRVASMGVELSTYFNSGVMVLNLRYLRQHFQLFRQTIDFLRRHPQSVFHDQDALNFLFGGKYLPLDSRFNRIVSRTLPEERGQSAVWHFAGVKPWLFYGSPMDMLYWKAMLQTPWQGQVLDHLAVAIGRVQAETSAVLAQEKAAAADRQRLRQLRRGSASISRTAASPRWVTLFPEAENLHLTKDVGMVPFVLQKHFGYDSKLVCYPNGAYPDLQQEVQGLKIEFLAGCAQDSLQAGCDYIEAYAQTIDVLHVFHFCVRSFEWIMLYKSLNPRGKVYLKLDADSRILQVQLTERMRQVLSVCDLVSAETKRVYEGLRTMWPVQLEYIPNGFYDFAEPLPLRWGDKENIICTVGRLGTKPKATQVLLEAFRVAAPQIPGWKLRLIGPVDPLFDDEIRRYFAENPQLAEWVEFVGEITDKRLLAKEYRRAKVFCLTSVAESFGIVLVEAASQGCLVISTDVGAAQDVTDGGYYGDVFPVGATAELAKLLIANCADVGRLEWVCRQAPHFACLYFHWVDLARVIDRRLTERRQTAPGI